MPINKTEAPELGVYRDVDFSTYLSWDAVNNSSLTPLTRSPAHYRMAQENPIVPSDAMRLGTLVHAGRLEPAALQERYAAMPDFASMVRTKDGDVPKNPRATNEYKELEAEFESANADKEIITLEQLNKMMGIVASLNGSPRALEYLCGGTYELSITWDDAATGLRCKARLDHWDAEHLRATDLKTCRDALQFEKQIANLHYDRQAAFYMDGLTALGFEPREFCIVAVETEPPYGVRSAPVGDRTLADGRRKYRKALRALANAKQSDNWPSYGNPISWDKPSWDFVDIPPVRLLIQQSEFFVRG